MANIEVGFVGGFGRSGSTLLERLISGLPGVCALGEVLHLWRRGVHDNEDCGCGKPFHDCPFWSEVGTVAFGGWDQVDVEAVLALGARLDRFRATPANLAATRLSRRRAALRQYADYFYRVYEGAAAVSGARIVVDSSKNASTAYALRAHESISLRVVHVVRDSRGVAFSWTKRVRRPEAGEASLQPLMDVYPPWVSAVLWNAHNAAFGILAKLETPIQKVFYEEFVDDPMRCMVDVADFLGVDASSMGNFVDSDVVRLQPSHQVAGNPMRFRVGEVQLRRDDAWQTEMPTADRRLVTALTWPLMKRYGYLPSSRDNR